MYLGRISNPQTCDLEDYIKNFGTGANILRGQDFSQPRGLKTGDTLSNGWRVYEVYHSSNSSIGIEFANLERRIFPPRIPLQLLSEKQGVLPINLRIGQILQTGCVILDTPKSSESVAWHDNQDETAIKLTGGLHGHNITVPNDIELAVFNEEFPPSPSSLLGAFTLSRMQSMKTWGALERY